MIHNKIPWASVIICPGVIPTRFYAPMHYFNWGKILNKLSWKFLNVLKSGAEKKIEASLFALNGIHRRINTIGTFSPHLNLIASSAYVGKTYPDLPKNFTVTGPWWLPEDDFDPPAHVEAFVKNGKADVVFTFGSMSMVEGETRKELFLETIEKAGVRAIIQKGWEGGHDSDLPENVTTVDYSLPFHYLFRQGKVVVHLGSSGTTIAACKAGAASVVVPHLADQRYWAAMLYDLGVSAKPISPDRLTADHLAEEIKKTLTDEGIQEKAAALKTHLAGENGTDVAVKTIEEYVYNIK